MKNRNKQTGFGLLGVTLAWAFCGCQFATTTRPMPQDVGLCQNPPLSSSLPCDKDPNSRPVCYSCKDALRIRKALALLKRWPAKCDLLLKQSKEKDGLACKHQIAVQELLIKSCQQKQDILAKTIARECKPPFGGGFLGGLLVGAGGAIVVGGVIVAILTGVEATKKP
jgi:hypothetical protein